jgi:hypothetical protein
MGLAYDRYLAVCITANNGWFEWTDQLDMIGEGAESSFVAHKPKSILPSAPFTSQPWQCFQEKVGANSLGGGVLRPVKPPALPEKGYVVCAVSPDGIKALLKSKHKLELYQPLLEWVCSEDHFGKIRIIAHGIWTEGTLASHQSPKSEALDQIEVNLVADFLYVCGLRSAASESTGRDVKNWFHSQLPAAFSKAEVPGIRTIQLDLCEGGEYIHQTFVQTLSKLNVHGIKVTASKKEVVAFPNREEIVRQAGEKAQKELKKKEPEIKAQDRKLWNQNMLNAYGDFVKKERAKIDSQFMMRYNAVMTNPRATLDETTFFKLYEDLIYWVKLVALMAMYNGGVPGQWGFINTMGKWEKLSKSAEKASLTT